MSSVVPKRRSLLDYILYSNPVSPNITKALNRNYLYIAMKIVIVSLSLIEEISHEREFGAGGAGFLGSHFCDRLSAAGDDILCIDNCCKGTKDNVYGLVGFLYYELMRLDLTYPLYVEVDQIYNLACPTSSIHY